MWLFGAERYKPVDFSTEVLDFRGLCPQVWSEVKKPLPEVVFNPVHFASIEWNARKKVDEEKYPDHEAVSVIAPALSMTVTRDSQYEDLAKAYDKIDLELSQLKQYACIGNENTIRVSLQHSHEIKLTTLEGISISMDAHKLLSVISNHLTLNHR
jgi:hypothetical protein